MKIVFHITGITLFALSLMGGYFLTNLWSLDPENWRLILGTRVGFALIAGVWGAYGFAKMAEFNLREILISILVTVFLMAAVNINPILDLASGPVHLDGSLAGYESKHGLLFRPRFAMSPAVFVNTIFLNADGNVYKLDSEGLQANRIEDALSNCFIGDSLEGAVLLHLDAMLDLNCPL